ncbi:hypothetical protein SEA_KEANU_23 [Streptomyces phage Keanu]|nr:hypothetical protein SEA_KEANU_23 [Streptomyces phage Keanu]
MTIRSIWHINNSQTREDTRFAPLGIMTPNSTSALSTANGVIPTANNPLNLTNTGAMSAQVEIGRAVVQGLLTQGCYPVVVTAPEALTFADGDASNPRIDSVMIVIRDDPYDSTGFTDVRLIIVPGTPAASPTAPALPTEASLRLWDVRVEAGISAGGGGIDWGTKVTDRRTYAVALGGIGVGNNPGAYAGQWRDSGGSAGTLSRYNGTAWESAIRLDSGGSIAIGDTNLRRDFSNVLATDDLFRIYRPVTSENAISLRLPTDTSASRWYINADGNMNWGPGGTTSTDTNLYRAGADQLKTDSKFSAEVEIQTTGFTNASGWSSTWVAKRTCGVVWITISSTRTGADITGDASGNISDSAIGTVPTGWRPTTEIVEGSACSGFGDGGVNLATSGIVTLRTWSNNSTIVQNSHNVRSTFCFVL